MFAPFLHRLLKEAELCGIRVSAETGATQATQGINSDTMHVTISLTLNSTALSSLIKNLAEFSGLSPFSGLW